MGNRQTIRYLLTTTHGNQPASPQINFYRQSKAISSRMSFASVGMASFAVAPKSPNERAAARRTSGDASERAPVKCDTGSEPASFSFASSLIAATRSFGSIADLIVVESSPSRFAKGISDGFDSVRLAGNVCRSLSSETGSGSWRRAKSGVVGVDSRSKGDERSPLSGFDAKGISA
jgi:hypothetical protein